MLRSRWGRPAVAGLVVLACAELGARVLFPLREDPDFDRVNYAPMARNPLAVITNTLGHASFRWLSEPDAAESVHRLNLYGFRDRTWPLRAGAGVTRVAFVGDSFVEGFLAGPGETIPAAFAAAAAAAGERVEAMNLGVGAAGLAEYFTLIADLVPRFRPDHLVLVLYANDFWPQRYQQSWLESREPRPLRPASRLVSVTRTLGTGQRVPRRWMDPPFAFLAPVPDPRNPLSDPRFDAYAAGFVAPEVLEVMRRGGLSPWLVNEAGELERSLRTPVALDDHLRALADFTSAHGVHAWIVYVPSRSQVSDRYLEAQLRFSRPLPVASLTGAAYQRHAGDARLASQRAGLPFLDLTPALRERELAGESLYFPYDGHMRPLGYTQSGRRVWTWWSREGGARRRASAAPSGPRT